MTVTRRCWVCKLKHLSALHF